MWHVGVENLWVFENKFWKVPYPKERQVQHNWWLTDHTCPAWLFHMMHTYYRTRPTRALISRPFGDIHLTDSCRPAPTYPWPTDHLHPPYASVLGHVMELPGPHIAELSYYAWFYKGPKICLNSHKWQQADPLIARKTQSGDCNQDKRAPILKLIKLTICSGDPSAESGWGS